ncbi:MAG: adenosine kinase [Desulfobacterota bacterium]|nr:adenosine kinase [Thermodesulfobacteriota bacterium]
MKLDVYALGSALMDIQIHVTDKQIADLGLQKGTMKLTRREEQERILQHLLGEQSISIDKGDERLQLAAGGSAANTVYGIAQLGGSAALCGKVARDRFGDAYIRNTRDSGVLFNGIQVDGTTGTCIVLITDDAQRTMLTHLGVASDLTFEDMDVEQLRQSAYLYLEGYLFDSDVATQTIAAAVAEARRHNVKIAITASDVFCVERHKDCMLELITNNADLVFANAQEACALSGKDTLDDALKTLTEMCRNIAVTNGERGSILCFEKTVVPIKPFIVSAIDTTGAGDSFAAGLLYGLTHGYSLEDSGTLASFFAARVVSQIGPRYAGDIRTEVRSLRLQSGK